MAVDIKTLSIGSHVEYDGKRVRICSLKTNMANYDDGKGKPRCFGSNLAYYKRMQPIPITSDLLKELGFEEDKTDIAKRVGGYYIYFHQINNLRWRVSLEEENCTNYGNTLCRYLHEAEAFLALHGVELIKE